MIGYAATAFAERDGWYSTDSAKAFQQAKVQSKRLLISFTEGMASDRQLDEEVFTSQEFKEYAKKNLILFKVDLANKDVSSDTLAQYRELHSRYGMRTMPTVIVTDAEGTEVGRITGYSGAGPADFIAKIDALVKPEGVTPALTGHGETSHAETQRRRGTEKATGCATDSAARGRLSMNLPCNSAEVRPFLLCASASLRETSSTRRDTNTPSSSHTTAPGIPREWKASQKRRQPAATG